MAALLSVVNPTSRDSTTTMAANGTKSSNHGDMPFSLSLSLSKDPVLHFYGRLFLLW